MRPLSMLRNLLALLAFLPTLVHRRLFDKEAPGADPVWADRIHDMAEEVRDHPATIADITDLADQVDAIFANQLATKLGTDFAGPDVTWQRWADLDDRVGWTSTPPPDYWVTWDGDTPTFALAPVTA